MSGISHLHRTLVGALILLALGPAQSALADRPARFRQSADALMEVLLPRVPEVPGVALAVVADGQVVLARGYGLADVERSIPADARTEFYIASVTKTYTALAATLLHESGAIDLDSSLRDHLEDSGIDPALVPAKTTLRDLLTHTAGLENNAITTRLAFTGEHTSEQLWNLLATTEAGAKGPGVFDYTNFGYNLLTMVLERELGRPWQDLLQDEIFDPAGLTRTTTRTSRPRREGWSVAVPYLGLRPGGLWQVPLKKTDRTMHSAGGIMTTAEDAARWLQVQIDGGQLDGRRVFPAAAVRNTQRALLTFPDEGRPPFGLTGHGAGWRAGSLLGRRVLHHSGGFPGFASEVSFMPEEGIGVAIFVNEGTLGARLPGLLAPWIYRWWLEERPEEPEALVAGIVELRDRFAEAIAAGQEKREARRWELTLPPAAYAGRYHSKALGTLEVREREGNLEVRFGPMRSLAEPFPAPDQMRVELIPGRGEILVFKVRDGVVRNLTYDGMDFSPVPD